MLRNAGIARYAARRAAGRPAVPAAVERPTPGNRPRLAGPLLVAAGDHDHLGGPLRLAEALARRDGVQVHVLAVVRPLPSLVSLGASLAADLEPGELDECRRERARARGRARVRESPEASVSDAAFRHARGAVLVAPRREARRWSDER